LYTNAQSLMAHEDEIQYQVMKKINPSFLALSETKLAEEIECDTVQNWLQFKTERNIAVRLIKQKKIEYYESMIDSNKENPKIMWKTLKEIIMGEPTDSSGDGDKKIIYVIKDKGTIENFKIVSIELEKIVMGLPNKKSTEEGINSDILKASFYVVKKVFVDIINNSLKEDCCPESWKLRR
ncbi:hypothetical protein ALC57_19058, partial [Trachymyrmex cornetzi]